MLQFTQVCMFIDVWRLCAAIPCECLWSYNNILICNWWELEEFKTTYCTGWRYWAQNTCVMRVCVSETHTSAFWHAHEIRAESEVISIYELAYCLPIVVILLLVLMAVRCIHDCLRQCDYSAQHVTCFALHHVCLQFRGKHNNRILWRLHTCQKAYKVLDFNMQCCQ